MPTHTIEEVLSPQNLSGLIQAEKDGLSTGLLPAGFTTVTRRVSGNQCTYDKVSGNRQVARLVQYGSESVRRKQKGVSQQTVTLMHTKEHQVYSPKTVLRAVGTTEIDEKGQREIARQTANFQYYFRNLRTAAVQKVLMSGILYFDGDGNMLADATGAAYSIDMGIPASNKDQCLQIDGATAIFGTSWDGSPDLTKDHDVLHETALKRTGYPLRYAVYGKNVKQYLQDYASTAGLLSGNPELQNSFRNGNQTFNMFNLEWVPGYNAFFVDANGEAQEIIGDDDVAYLPEPDITWYEMIEGSEYIPTDLNIKGSAVDIASSLNEVNGMFSYATITDDPVAIKQIAGDTFLPVIKVPAAVYIATVKF